MFRQCHSSGLHQQHRGHGVELADRIDEGVVIMGPKQGAFIWRPCIFQVSPTQWQMPSHGLSGIIQTGYSALTSFRQSADRLVF